MNTPLSRQIASATGLLLGIATFPIKLGLIGLFLYTLGGGFTLFSPAQFIGGL